MISLILSVKIKYSVICGNSLTPIFSQIRMGRRPILRKEKIGVKELPQITEYLIFTLKMSEIMDSVGTYAK